MATDRWLVAKRAGYSTRLRLEITTSAPSCAQLLDASRCELVLLESKRLSPQRAVDVSQLGGEVLGLCVVLPLGSVGTCKLVAQQPQPVRVEEPRAARSSDRRAAWRNQRGRVPWAPWNMQGAPARRALNVRKN